jgi:serine/threonine protein kinase
MPIVSGQVLGPYLIQGKLGEGGMGSVYKAQQSGVNRVVVVKVLLASVKDNPQMLDRFRRELDIIAQLEHPHILPVYDFGEADGSPYIVMRYVGGGSLDAAMARRQFDRVQLMHILEQIADALDYAHGRGIIHRDLKPANVLLDERGNAYLADFGLAKTMEGGAELTKTGSILGTPAYMSPEQGRGEKLDLHTDIYSLGVMAYEVLSGRLPFQGNSAWEVISKHLTETPALISQFRAELPAAVDTVIAQALSKNRGDRPARAGEFIKALQQALGSAAPISVPVVAAAPSILNSRLSRPPGNRSANVAPPMAAESMQARAQSTVILRQSAFIAVPVLLVTMAAIVVIAGLAGWFLFRDRLFPNPVFSYSVGTSPRAMAFDGHNLWVASGVGQYVARIKADSCDQSRESCGQALATFPADGLVTGIAYDGSSIWLANGLGLSLTRLDAATGQTTTAAALTDVPSNLLFAAGHLWVASSKAGKLTKVSMDGQIVGAFPVSGGPLAMAFDGQNLWVATESSGQLIEMNTDTGGLLKTIALGGSVEVNALADDGASIWVALKDQNQVIQVDRNGTIVSRIAVGASPVAIITGGGSLWVANRGSGTITRLDPLSKTVLATQAVSPKPFALSYVSCGEGCGDLWIIDVENDLLQRLRIK